MTKHDKITLNRYYRSIRSWLPCGKAQRAQILCSVKDNVAAYLEDHPDADFLQIQAHFGSPQQIAAALVEGMDTPSLLTALRNRRRVLNTVIAGLAAALIIWGCGVGIAVAEQHTASPEYIVDQTP